ncbi:hypothetical protein TCAL_10168 [Tigriopus californicus]|uniref:Uncharacterized protein n=1 Tax=Tigriopus californicus TaxID=6832 RepID=A0A553P7M2_TIGCA|nr:uncharacterized protein LOC131877762 [Tigriopus californicus]TRY73681.1 hypothetical protein TCAL_10168 [Tigriopus californicus]
MWTYDGNTCSTLVVISIALGLISSVPAHGQEEGTYQDAIEDRFSDLNPNLVESMLDRFLYNAMNNNNGMNGMSKTMAGNEWSMGQRRKKELTPRDEVGGVLYEAMNDFPEEASLPSAFRLKKRQSQTANLRGQSSSSSSGDSSGGRLRKTRSDAFRLKRVSDAFRLKRGSDAFRLKKRVGPSDAFRLKRGNDSFRLKRQMESDTPQVLMALNEIIPEDYEDEQLSLFIDELAKRDYNPSYRLKRDLSNAYRLRKRSPHMKAVEANVKMTPSYRL